MATMVGEELFDDTAGYESDAGIRFASNLTPIERKRATIIYNLFKSISMHF